MVGGAFNRVQLDNYGGGSQKEDVTGLLIIQDSFLISVWMLVPTRSGLCLKIKTKKTLTVIILIEGP